MRWIVLEICQYVPVEIGRFFLSFCIRFCFSSQQMFAVGQLAFFWGGGSHILWIKTSKMKITKTSVPLVLFMTVQFGSPPVAGFGDIDYTVTS